MLLYNSKTRTREQFIPREEGKVSIYTCGPTVYHFAHIGNLRSYTMEDVLEKYLRYVGYDVKRVMNITDVGHLSSDGDTGEDKMLKGAKREKKTVLEIAQFYTDAFFSDCKKLNIKYPDVVEPATNCIPEFIEMIETLLKKGFAYEAGGNIYFDTSKLEKYYVFNDFKEEDLEVGVRESVEEDTNKRNKADFVLWFTKSKFDDQELKWNSPWGIGYPGWHIECSCIAGKHLGEYVDIHCGGIDNAFPHHTNEIAQSEATYGHSWCHYWMHVHHLNTNSGKMSKSKGEFLTVSLLEEKGYMVEGDAMSVRLQNFVYGLLYIIIGVGAVFSILAFVLLVMSILLLIEKNKEKISNLYSIGYSVKQISRIYCLFAFVLDMVVWSIAAIIATLLYPHIIGIFQVMSPGFEPASQLLLWTAAIGFTVAFALVHALIIYRNVKKHCK